MSLFEHVETIGLPDSCGLHPAAFVVNLTVITFAHAVFGTRDVQI